MKGNQPAEREGEKVQQVASLSPPKSSFNDDLDRIFSRKLLHELNVTPNEFIRMIKNTLV
jgi:hypothetical protein